MSDGKRTGKLSKDGFPHNYLEDALGLSIVGADVETGDDTELPDGSIEIVESDRRLSLEAIPNWNTVTISAVVDIPEKVYNTLPPEERGDYAPSEVDAEEPPIRFVLAVRSSRTILRKRLTHEDLSIDVAEAGETDVEFELQSHEVAGDVEVKPFIVRAEDQSKDDGYASSVGDRLASAEKWTVRVDRPDEDGGFLNPIIEDFDMPGFPGDEHLHFLKFESPSTPKLYLNANHPQLVDVLNKEGSWGANARFRDVLFDYIEQSVWNQLLLRTANDTDVETGEQRHPWQEDVVSLFADDLFEPEDDEADVAIKMAEYADSEDFDVLVDEIERAVQKRVNLPDAALSLLQEGIDND
ncbi:hypothetical protein GLW36_05765 [Halorubrum terrestre]|uniref:Uncharacterized protein n=1 Tax=Halorubrum distributum TaxID=29283 RepID=A0A6B1ID52_9EURY|nr:hypothetical protein [Halorubrum terrestre]MYL16156.1 hypothetical protein [Halorubrum terrestre]